MSKKSRKKRTGVVYSTNSDFEYAYDTPEEEASIEPGKQQLHISIEKKGRRGKVVTIVEGFQGPDDDLGDLASRLKSSCGVGGSAKDGLILLQGDLRGKVRELLIQWGYGVKGS